MGIVALVGKRVTKEVAFMGDKIKINKLTVAEVTAIQEASKDLTENSEDGLLVLRQVIRSSVEGADELTDDDFQTFPLDELSKLSTEIMKFSGLGGTEETKKA
jgi:hypothetical protein